MMTTDTLWNAYIDELLGEFERRASSYVQDAARGTGMNEYQIRGAVEQARASVERFRTGEKEY